MYVDTSDLIKFIGEFRRTDSRRVVANCLNLAGDAVRRQYAEDVASRSGLTPSQVARVIDYNPATGRRLRYEIRIREDDLREAIGRRRMQDRDWQGRKRDFDERLVNVRTMQDEKVCPICEQIAEEGPYSVAEINYLKTQHPHFLNTASNCRCVLIPFAPKKRLEMSTSITPNADEIVRMTIGQLADQLAQEARLSIKIKRR